MSAVAAQVAPRTDRRRGAQPSRPPRRRCPDRRRRGRRRRRGCGSRAGDDVNIYLYQKPKNWNPLAPPNGPDTQVETLIYDALLMVNDNYDYEPRLAENWTASPDARTFTFNLRPA